MRKLLLLTLALLVLVVAADAQKFSVLYNLGSNSGDPRHAIYIGIFAQGRDGNLYSTSPYGGTSDKGTIFQLTSAGKMKVLYSFDGKIGALPRGGLTLGTDGSLYGTTSFGGTNNGGTVFKITTSGKLTVLHNFINSSDGLTPYAAPIQGLDGNFYGTTTYANARFGSVYKMTPSGKLTTLFVFNDSTSGQTPGALVLGTDGNLYGTTQLGGANDKGAVFKITPQGKFTLLHSFNGTDGQAVLGPLIQASDGNFYGTTQMGGAKRVGGAIYKMTPAGGLTDIFSFNSRFRDPKYPYAGLVQATDGKFYGATTFGGMIGWGALFQATSNDNFKDVYDFDLKTGADPQVSLFQHTNGTLYGDTEAGGTKGNGVLYSLSIGLGPFVSFVGPLSSGKVGKTIEILGQGFTGTSKVSFHDGVSATFTIVSDTYLTAVVPSGATAGSVTVTTPGGTLTSNKAFRVAP